MHDHLVRRGVAQPDIELVMPFGVPIPPSPDASAELLSAFAQRGIAWHPDAVVRSIDAARGVAVLSDGTESPFDLFLGVPVHRAPQVVVEAGLTVDGWIPVDPLTLETSFADVYAVGDCTSVGTPKAGVFSEGQAAIVADRIIATAQGVPAEAQYDGRGLCYLELGEGRIAKVDVTFRSGERPVGDLVGPSVALMADKHEFGASRIARWFAGAT
jgi:sulfide:quinone oxidoreductase